MDGPSSKSAPDLRDYNYCDERTARNKWDSHVKSLFQTDRYNTCSVVLMISRTSSTKEETTARTYRDLERDLMPVFEPGELREKLIKSTHLLYLHQVTEHVLLRASQHILVRAVYLTTLPGLYAIQTKIESAIA